MCFRRLRHNIHTSDSLRVTVDMALKTAREWIYVKQIERDVEQEVKNTILTRKAA
jgi:hypothetical protein